MNEQKLTLRFKRSQELDQIQDRTGFVWLPGHAKEVDLDLGQQLLKSFPKNFEKILIPTAAIQVKGTIEAAPDKMVTEERPTTKKKEKK